MTSTKNEYIWNVAFLFKSIFYKSNMPSLPEKILVPLLALMMVGDARAALTTFTNRKSLKTAVDACLHYTVSEVGNCCAPEANIDHVYYANIKTGTPANDGTCRETGYTHLRYWDVSQVTDMHDSELCVISIDLSVSPFCVLPALVQGVCSCDLTLCLFCVFLPLILMILMYSVRT